MFELNKYYNIGGNKYQLIHERKTVGKDKEYFFILDSGTLLRYYSDYKGLKEIIPWKEKVVVTKYIDVYKSKNSNALCTGPILNFPANEKDRNKYTHYTYIKTIEFELEEEVES